MRYLLIFTIILAGMAHSRAYSNDQLSAHQIAETIYGYSEKSETQGWLEGLSDSERRSYDLILTSVAAAYYSAWTHHLNALPDEEKNTPLCEPDTFAGAALEDAMYNMNSLAMQVILNPHINDEKYPLPVALGRFGETAFRHALQTCKR